MELGGVEWWGEMKWCEVKWCEMDWYPRLNLREKSTTQSPGLIADMSEWSECLTTCD